jgi:hypothetical protein
MCLLRWFPPPLAIINVLSAIFLPLHAVLSANPFATVPLIAKPFTGVKVINLIVVLSAKHTRAMA